MTWTGHSTPGDIHVPSRYACSHCMTTEQTDITSLADIQRLVDGFYVRVRADAVLGPIFDDVAHTDWNAHLPKLYDFWQSVLFGASSFRGNPLAVHLALADKVQLGAPEFRRWLDLFSDNVDALFSGPIAEDAKVRASRIAAVMQHHISAKESEEQSI